MRRATRKARSRIAGKNASILLYARRRLPGREYSYFEVSGEGGDQVALGTYGAIRRLGVVTPYMPVADARVRRFFTDCGYQVVNLDGLKCASPVLIAHVSEAELREAIRRVDGEGVEAIVQVGTNLAMARLAALAEFWLGKPVMAIDTATYWWALRRTGITDRRDGYGALLRDH